MQAAAMEGVHQTDRERRTSQKHRFQSLTFMEAIEDLSLPKPQILPKGARGGKARKEINFTREHMIQTIDLSGFSQRRISRSGLRELLDGLELLPCMRSLNLSNNGITDDFDKEVLELFSLTKIKAINLSFNSMKTLGLQIGKKMRDEVTHINWIDMTMNDFDNDTATVNMLVQGVKKQVRIIYVGLTVQGSQSDQLMRVMQPKKPPTSISVNMRNSRLTKNCFTYMGKCMKSADFCLTALNLKFCFLQFDQVKELGDALRYNKTLIKLDLSNNGLTPRVGKYLLDALVVNSYLSEINFHGNQLNDDWAAELAFLLENNQVLYKVDISANPISPVGARLVLNAVRETNDTLGDLGDLDESTFMGVRIREELRQAIKLNNSSHDKKKAHFKDAMANNRTNNVDSDAHGQEAQGVVSTATQAEYPLLKPITFTNIVTDDFLDSLVWNLR